MTRTFWHHPESDSFWATDDPSHDDGDGMSVEISRESYLDGILEAFRRTIGPKRVVAFGGRDFSDQPTIDSALDDFHRDIGISVVIEGEARGADLRSKAWAIKRGVPVEPYAADWDRLGNAAGPTRNQRMIDVGRPDCGIAFRGGDGTADMKLRCELAGIPVFEIF